jgi:hypothetical protein
MFGLSSPELFERCEGETVSVIAAGANGTRNKWADDPDLPRTRAKLDEVRRAVGVTLYIRVRIRYVERGRSIVGPVYAAKADCKDSDERQSKESVPTRAADDVRIKLVKLEADEKGADRYQKE